MLRIAKPAGVREPTQHAGAGVLLAACALSACTPVVANENAFGVGIYSVKSRHVSEHSHVCEVRGVGVLAFEGRVIVGYADVAGLFCGPEETDVRARVGGSEVFVGRAAEAEAVRMADEAVRRAWPADADEREPDPSVFRERDVR